MHAHEELQTNGELGDSGKTLLIRLLKQLVRQYGFPPPDGYERWTRDAYDEALQKVFAARQTFQLTLFEQATSPASFERLALSIMHNALIDIDRGTPAGRMVRRLRNVLRKEPALEETGPPDHPRGWAASGGPYARTAKTKNDLLRAAYRVSGSIDALNRSGPTPRPIRVLLSAVGIAVVTEAAGSVSESDMATTVLNRFDLWSEPRTEAAASSSDAEAIEEMAEELWVALDDEQRSVLVHPDTANTRFAHIYEDLGRREIDAVRAELAAHIESVAANHVDAEALVRYLRSSHRTIDERVTSSESKTSVITGEEGTS